MFSNENKISKPVKTIMASLVNVLYSASFIWSFMVVKLIELGGVDYVRLG
jgi:hypothetical protein